MNTKIFTSELLARLYISMIIYRTWNELVRMYASVAECPTLFVVVELLRSHEKKIQAESGKRPLLSDSALMPIAKAIHQETVRFVP